jgi:hypothetical protein
VNSGFPDQERFTNISSPLLTDDSNYIVLRSASRLSHYDQIYSASQGALIFDGFSSRSRGLAVDFVAYRENGDFLRITSSDLALFNFSDLNCSAGSCQETPIAANQPL